jgi:hypothetical protein
LFGSGSFRSDICHPYMPPLANLIRTQIVITVKSISESIPNVELLPFRIKTSPLMA